MQIMEILTEVKKCIFYQYSDFDSRSNRKEFWLFFLFAIFLNLAIALLYKMTVYVLEEYNVLVARLSFIITIFAISIPCIAAIVRRFHDTGRSGWEIVLFALLLCLTYFILPKDDLPITLVLAVVIKARLIYILAKKGDFSENKYGIPQK